MTINWLTIRKFAEQSGYSEHAIRGKIRDGVWLEGQLWVKAPDNRVLISVDGYNNWVEGTTNLVPTRQRRSKSPLPFDGSDHPKRLSGSPPPLV